MEKLKAKHDHKLTDILKVVIFGIFLILPFMVYAPNALYYGVNEYATNETTTNVDIQYEYETNEVQDAATDLINGNVYLFTFNLTYGTESTLTTLYSNSDVALYYHLIEVKGSFVPNKYNETGYINNIQYKPTWLNTGADIFKGLNIENISQFEFVSSGTLSANQRSGYIKMALQYNGFYNQNIFDDNITVVALPNQYNKQIIEVEENVEQTITESMNVAWQRMWETPLFNWTSQSILKQGLDNFTGVFGISDTSYFTNLIVYELIMVAIYIVIDIVITMFKWLTHLIGEK